MLESGTSTTTMNFFDAMACDYSNIKAMKHGTSDSKLSALLHVLICVPRVVVGLLDHAYEDNKKLLNMERLEASLSYLWHKKKRPVTSGT
jgi:hypothetical protein